MIWYFYLPLRSRSYVGCIVGAEMDGYSAHSFALSPRAEDFFNFQRLSTKDCLKILRKGAIASRILYIDLCSCDFYRDLGDLPVSASRSCKADTTSKISKRHLPAYCVDSQGSHFPQDVKLRLNIIISKRKQLGYDWSLSKVWRRCSLGSTISTACRVKSCISLL